MARTADASSCSPTSGSYRPKCARRECCVDPPPNGSHATCPPVRHPHDEASLSVDLGKRGRLCTALTQERFSNQDEAVGRLFDTVNSK